MEKNLSEKIYLVMATDDNFAKHLCVAVCSILKNLSSDVNLHLYILHENLSNSNKQHINTLRKISNFRIDFICVGLGKIAKLRAFSSPYISQISNARLMIPSLLPNINKCIYLDSDVIVRHDIKELWNIDIGDNFFAAVEDSISQYRKKRLKIPEQFIYFNSGVLLMNLKKMREKRVESIIKEFIDQEYRNLSLGDQDVLNALFYNKCKILPLKWNMTTSIYICDNTFNTYHYAEIRKALDDPYICHFTYEKKPDSFLSRHPYSYEYRHYIKFTPWKNEKLKDVSFNSLLISFFYRFSSRFFYLKMVMREKFPFIFKFLKVVRSKIAIGSKKVNIKNEYFASN